MLFSSGTPLSPQTAFKMAAEDIPAVEDIPPAGALLTADAGRPAQLWQQAIAGFAASRNPAEGTGQGGWGWAGGWEGSIRFLPRRRPPLPPRRPTWKALQVLTLKKEQAVRPPQRPSAAGLDVEEGAGGEAAASAGDGVAALAAPRRWRAAAAVEQRRVQT